MARLVAREKSRPDIAFTRYDISRAETWHRSATDLRSESAAPVSRCRQLLQLSRFRIFGRGTGQEACASRQTLSLKNGAALYKELRASFPSAKQQRTIDNCGAYSHEDNGANQQGLEDCVVTRHFFAPFADLDFHIRIRRLLQNLTTGTVSIQLSTLEGLPPQVPFLRT